MVSYDLVNIDSGNSYLPDCSKPPVTWTNVDLLLRSCGIDLRGFLLAMLKISLGCIWKSPILKFQMLKIPLGCIWKSPIWSFRPHIPGLYELKNVCLNQGIEIWRDWTLTDRESLDFIRDEKSKTAGCQAATSKSLKTHLQWKHSGMPLSKLLIINNLSTVRIFVKNW